MTRDVVVVEYGAMFITWLTVSVVYHVLTRGTWWRSPEGRLMMADSLLFAWLAGLVLVSVFLHDWPGRVWISIVSLGLLTVTGLWRLRLILRAQRLRRDLLARRDAEMKRDADRAG